MLYASTVATLKREFGLTYITEELRASSNHEMTLQSYQQHARTQAAPPPRTMREEEMMEIHQREVKILCIVFKQVHSFLGNSGYQCRYTTSDFTRIDISIR